MAFETFTNTYEFTVIKSETDKLALAGSQIQQKSHHATILKFTQIFSSTFFFSWDGFAGLVYVNFKIRGLKSVVRVNYP